MKAFIRLLLAGVIFIAGQGVMRADPSYSFSFTIAQAHTAGAKKEYTYEVVKNQKWSYSVTMENKSFKDVSDIQIKYVMFIRQDELYEEKPIGKEDLQRHEGTTTIKLIKNNDKITFSTDAIALQNVTPVYADDYWGGAKGALRGLWMRVYVGGKMVAEQMDPANLASKGVTFDPPPKEKN